MDEASLRHNGEVKLVGSRLHHHQVAGPGALSAYAPEPGEDCRLRFLLVVAAQPIVVTNPVIGEAIGHQAQADTVQPPAGFPPLRSERDSYQRKSAGGNLCQFKPLGNE